MPEVLNLVRRGFYLDSVALMRLSQTLSQMQGVEAAALMIGSDSNRRILADAQLLAAEGAGASANDLIIAIRAHSLAEATAALAEAEALLAAPRPRGRTAGEYRSRSLDAAVATLGGANFALISVPGEFAAFEAHKALRRGLNVMLFSDNVEYENELALKSEA
jgi:FdrA protein